MTTSHRNKTLATILAATLGGIGLHRFYLYGKNDWLAWLRAASLPISGLAILVMNNSQPLFAGLLFVLSVLVGFVEALKIGLTTDEQWDIKHNSSSEKKSKSHWIHALILVLVLAIGAAAIIAVMARSFDLLFTGGAYG